MVTKKSRYSKKTKLDSQGLQSDEEDLEKNTANLLNAHFEEEITFGVDQIDKDTEESERNEKIKKIMEEIKSLDQVKFYFINIFF